MLISIAMMIHAKAYTSLFDIEYSMFDIKTDIFDQMSNLPEYTKQQLTLRNGQDKPEIWIAYKGLIYDVGRSRLWKNGKHYEHWAGQDLTDELGGAPHDDWVFQNFDPVGKLK